MFHKPSFLNAANGVALLILFAVSLSVGVADFKWSALFSLSD
ncbi:ABC transporter permease, partial [Neisseria sp. P0021.S007]